MERQFGKKLMTSNTFSGTFPSPESPQDSENGREIMHAKGWYSERVPQPGRKGYVAASALMPFSSGRTLPSKWDDAERWISSPISVGNYFNGPEVNKGAHLSHNYQRRAKSKSGPLGPHGLGSYGSYNTFSPVLGEGVISGVKWRNSVAVEPSAEVEARREEMDGGGEGRRRSFDGSGDSKWLDLWSDPPSHIDKWDDTNLANNGFESINDNLNHNHNHNHNQNQNDVNITYNDEARVDRVISRRDMATQMYPESESSAHSAYSPSPLLNNNESNTNVQSQELFEVRDVQIDRQTSRTTQTHTFRENDPFENFLYSSTIVDEHNKMLKLQGKEARINAWENLQKAKAESAIQKLEMKLEKKRAKSTEKIIEKLRRAEVKAQKKRGLLDIVGNTNDHVQSKSRSRTRTKIPSFCRNFGFSFTSICFCHPF